MTYQNILNKERYSKNYFNEEIYSQSLSSISSIDEESWLSYSSASSQCIPFTADVNNQARVSNEYSFKDVPKPIAIYSRSNSNIRNSNKSIPRQKESMTNMCFRKVDNQQHAIATEQQISKNKMINGINIDSKKKVRVERTGERDKHEGTSGRPENLGLNKAQPFNFRKANIRGNLLERIKPKSKMFLEIKGDNLNTTSSNELSETCF